MEGYIGEIRLFGGNFGPRNWAICQGQLLPIALNTALFSILGTTYGGNGATTFALPDFRGRMARGTGTGPGLSNITLGEVSGTENHTLIITEMPAHNHTLTLTNATQGSFADSPGNSNSPVSHYPAIVPGVNAYSTTQDAQMASYNIGMGTTGGSLPFNIRRPYIALNFIICLQGIFPSRN